MSTIVTRAGKGSPLTNNEIDSNFTNLNTDKLEDGDLSVTTNSVGTAALAYSSGVFTYTPPDLSGYAALSGATFTGEVEATGFNGDLTGAILFKGQAGEALTKGDPVYISGISGNTTIVSKADADDASKMPCFGLVDATVNANAACSVVTFGTLQGLDTSSFSEGDELFVSATGTLTTTAPTGESALLQKIAKVTKSHASSGSIKVSGAGRTNATPNLNDGNFFLGNGSNQAVSADFSTSVTNIALPLSGGALTGAVTTSSTFDGRDVATDGAKLDGIEAGADVTDTANVTAAGALMDSEVANLAQVKAFDSSDYATAAQGTLADNALPKSGGTMTGALILNNTGSVKVSAGTTGQREGSPAAGMFRYNTTEGKFEGYSTEWGEIGGGAIDLLVNTFTGNGSTTAYTMSSSPLIANTLVYIDGVYQNKSAYSIANDVITFSAAPASGAVIEATAATVGEVSTASTSFAITQLTGNGSTTAFTLSAQTVENNTNVYFDGVYQSKANYTVSGSTITFSTAPANGVAIEVMGSEGITLTIGTPDNGTVTTAKIVDDAVTSDKLAHSLDVVTDLSVGGASNGVEISNGAIALKNSGTQSKIDFYCETSNAHYTRLQAAPHSSYSGNIVLTLPASDGDAGQFLQSNGSGVMSWAAAGGLYNDWLIKTANYTMVSGDQIIVNKTTALTMTLPASPSAGDVVTVKATGGGTVTIGRNSSNINSTAADGTLNNGFSTQLVYVDGTIGWLQL